MTSDSTKSIPRSRKSRRLGIFSTTGLIRSKLACAIGLASSSQAMLEAELDEALARSRYAAVRESPSGESEARRASPVIATATGRGRCWEPSGRWRSRCRARG